MIAAASGDYSAYIGSAYGLALFVMVWLLMRAMRDLYSAERALRRLEGEFPLVSKDKS